MDEISINGQAYPIHFGLSVTKNYCKVKNIELHEFDGVFGKINFEKVSIADIEDLVLLINEGFKRGCEKKGIVFPLTEDDLVDAILEEDGFIGLVMESFMDSLTKKKVKENPTS